MTSLAKASDEIERKDYCLARIEDASVHLLGVIDDMLDMAKIEAETLRLTREDFDFVVRVKRASAGPRDDAQVGYADYADHADHTEAQQDNVFRGTSEDEISCFKGYRILLAEDMLINQEIIIAFLEQSALDIICVTNGARALTLYKEDPQGYDTILMDVQMPEMDGLEATRCIRTFERQRDIPPVPIIAITANASREDRQCCLDAGMNDYQRKPVDLQELMVKLRRYLPEGAGRRRAENKGAQRTKRAPGLEI
jgi:CheY-like chemotaxis protein